MPKKFRHKRLAWRNRRYLISAVDLEGIGNPDLSTSIVPVEYNPEKVDIEEIKSAVNSLGYKFAGGCPPLFFAAV